MRVLMFGWEFPPHISGGLGTACFGITEGLLKQDVDVLFVVPKLFGDENKGQFKFVNASDIQLNIKNTKTIESWNKLTYLQVDSSLLPYFSPQEYLTSGHSYFKTEETGQHPFSSHYKFSGQYGKDLMAEMTRYALVATEISNNNTFDIIHAHDWLTFPAGIAAKEASGKKLIAHVHATEYDRSGENINKHVYEIEKKGMEKADLIIAVSEFTKQIIIQRYNIPADKIKVVYNGVIPKEDKKKKDKIIKEQIVTFMGRITFQKGPDYFVETANQVIKKYPNVRFVMAGNGDMMNQMIKRVAELRLSSRFHFTGFLKGEDVDRMYDMSDIFVMPSVSEPFGIAPLEAMQANLPVIISKQSGVSEVIKNAIKVDFWDTDELANSIYSLLKYKGLTKTFAANGKREAEKLKWDNSAIKLKKIYKYIINNSTE